MQVFHAHEIEGSGGVSASEIYGKEGSGTPNYVEDSENEGLFRKVVISVLMPIVRVSLSCGWGGTGKRGWLRMDFDLAQGIFEIQRNNQLVLKRNPGLHLFALFWHTIGLEILPQSNEWKST